MSQPTSGEGTWSRQRKLPPGDVLLSDWLSGLTYREMAERYQVTRLQTVYQALKRHCEKKGIEWPISTERRKDLWSQKVRRSYERFTLPSMGVQFVIEAHLDKTGLSLRQLAPELGVSYTYLTRIMRGQQKRVSPMYVAHIYQSLREPIPPHVQAMVGTQRQRRGVRMHPRWANIDHGLPPAEEQAS